jgi:hypothetical protein
MVIFLAATGKSMPNAHQNQSNAECFLLFEKVMCHEYAPQLSLTNISI